MYPLGRIWFLTSFLCLYLCLLAVSKVIWSNASIIVSLPLRTAIGGDEQNEKEHSIQGFQNYKRRAGMGNNNIFHNKMFFWNSIILRILTCSLFKGMEFHEELHNLGAKEGLKGRKLNKATESFAWNITVLKVNEIPRDLLCLYYSSPHVSKV